MLHVLVNPASRQPALFRTIARQFFEDSTAIHAKELIDRLQTNAEKARVSHELLIKGGLPESMQEALVCVLAEYGTYQQLVSLLDSKMVTARAAIDALKAGIYAISERVITNTRSVMFHPRS